MTDYQPTIEAATAAMEPHPNSALLCLDMQLLSHSYGPAEALIASIALATLNSGGLLTAASEQPESLEMMLREAMPLLPALRACLQATSTALDLFESHIAARKQ